MSSILEQVVADISEATFFKELCFTGQVFAQSTGENKELADVFVWLESESLIIQIKERSEKSNHDSDSLTKWFDKKVMTNGSNQIADTISFLQDHQDTKVQNSRGRDFLFRDLNVEPRQNVIVYGSLRSLAELPNQDLIYISKKSGPIHLIESTSFGNLLRWTVTPRELLDYLKFREQYITNHAFANKMSEKWVFGRFVQDAEINNEDLDLETWDGEGVVDNLNDDTSDIDLRVFFDHIGNWAKSRNGNESIFHKLILECAHLSRSAMREFKRRLILCQENLNKPIPETLYRFENPVRDCVFVFGVMPEGGGAQNEAAASGASALAKYDRKVSKVVGFFTAPVGTDDVATIPVYLEYPWVYDEAHENFLAKSNPFRPLKSDILYGYNVNNAESESN